MIKPNFLVISAIGIVSLIIATDSSAEQVIPNGVAHSPSGNPADEAAIRRTLELYSEAWSKGDAKTATSFFTSELDYINSAGMMIKGRPEIERLHALYLSDAYEDTKHSTVTTSVRFIKPDVAIAQGTFEVTNIHDPTGRESPTRTGLFTAVLINKDGSWWITARHTSVSAGSNR